MAAREGRAGQSLRIRLLLAAEAAHGQIFEKIDRGHRAEAVAAASGQSPTGPSSPWPALMTLNGAARTYAGLPLAHSKLAVRTAVGCDGNGEQTIGKHADACIESLCMSASVPQVACCAARRLLHWPQSFVFGAFRPGSVGIRVVPGGNIDCTLCHTVL